MVFWDLHRPPSPIHLCRESRRALGRRAQVCGKGLLKCSTSLAYRGIGAGSCLCGFIAAAALGVAALLAQDPIGYGFLALAVIGYYFHQTRLVPAVLWLLVGAYGAAGGLAGDAVDWVECAL